MSDESSSTPPGQEPPPTQWLGPIKSFFIYHILDNGLFWIGLLILFIFTNEGFSANLYTWLSPLAPLASSFQAAYEWGYSHQFGMLGVLFILSAISWSYIRLKVTRFVIEEGVLIVTRGKFSPNPFCLFQRNDYTVALNLIYDVDVKKTLFQYIFGGGDVYIRTASQDIFHLEFVEDVHKLRSYLLEHSGIKNKPVIGIY